MKDMRLKAMLAAPGALFAAYLWLLLYVILSVPLWVTFVASGAVLMAFTLAAATVRGSAAPADPRRGDIVVGDDGVVMNPLVNVVALRLRFALSLGLMFLGGWLVVETLAFSTGATRWLTFENAIALLALAVTGLVVHEFSTERVVHVLEVAGWRHAEDRPAARAAA